MIRVIRNFILIAFSVAMVAMIVLISLGGYFVNRAESPLTTELISRFRPEEYDNFNYTAGLKFAPLRLQVNNLRIESSSLRVRDTDFSDAKIEVKSIICDAWKLIEDNHIEIHGADGRSFTGSLSLDQLEDFLEDNNEFMSDLDISVYTEDECMIVGYFGMTTAAPMTIIGTWGVDDRGVATLLDPRFYNPDSYVPEGMIDLLEDQISFDIRIGIFSEEIPATDVVFSSAGITITAEEPE